MSRSPVLRIRGLEVSIGGPLGPGRVVRGVDLDLDAGETLGLVGESGSGKTITALSVLGLLPRGARVESGSISYRGVELVRAPARALRKIRGAEIGMVFQEPATSLHPMLPIGSQISEAIEAHDRTVSPTTARKRSVDLLERVGVPDPSRRLLEYPHSWSGGMRQRAMIAIAIANQPRILIADEPTTALDVTIQAQILELLRSLAEQSEMALLMISHDLGVIAEMADRVAVMYAGAIVESGRTVDLFRRPRHPYTAGLIDSVPRLDHPGGRLPYIPGRPPDPSAVPAGCSFHPRCRLAGSRCSEEIPALLSVDQESDRQAACFFHDRVSLSGLAPSDRGRDSVDGNVVLEVEDLRVHFGGGRRRDARVVRAVDGVSLEITAGETLALVGESGCGKTTLARAILDLVPKTAGVVRFRGDRLDQLTRGEKRSMRRHMQAVFQDPYGSLNPRMRVRDIVAAPLQVHRVGDRSAISSRVAELLSTVGLGDELAERRPAALSGGQRQRVSIARALALDPALLVLDEPLTALDVSIQAQIINLLADLQERLGLSYLLIAHDLAAVRHMADRVAVMYLGRIAEMGDRDTIFERARHPYTRALLSASPVPDPAASHRRRIVLTGEVPDPAAIPAGCRFSTRCYRVESKCFTAEPELWSDPPGCACFFPVTEPPDLMALGG